MKKSAIFSAILIGIVILLALIVTEGVDHKPYIISDYYKKSSLAIGELEESTVVTFDSVQAGFSKISITPKITGKAGGGAEGEFGELPLAGYGSRKGKAAAGIHDSVFVRAIALKTGQKVLVFAGADLLIMPPEIIDSVVVFLSARGISRDQLIFSATHTHSSIGAWGSGFLGEQFAGEENEEVKRWLVLKISQAVTTALADLKPARLGSGSFDAGEFTRNRLIGGTGTKNDDFSFIRIDQKGDRSAVIGSFSAHSTTLGSRNMDISADYPGFWARKLEAGPAEVALFAAGSTGSQSPVGIGKEFDRAKMIGEALADSLNFHLPQIVLNEKITCASASLKMELPSLHLRLTSKINLSSALSKHLMPLPENVFLQAVRLNNLVWITTPADFSGEYALQIKQALSSQGFHANVASFNGSYVGYIIPGRYFYLDEYEPKTMGWFGPCMGDYTMELIRRITDIVIAGKPSH